MRTIITKYYLYTFLISLHFFSAVLVPFFTDWGGISKTQMMILQSWFMLWIFLLEIPTGVIADYLGRKHSVAIGAFLSVVTSIVYASIPSFEIFLLGEFLFAAAYAFISGAEDAFLYDSLKEHGQEHESKRIFGMAHSIMLFGFLVSAPIGSFIASRFGLNYPMLFRAIPSLIAFFIVLSLPEPKTADRTSEKRRYLDIAKKGFMFFYKHKLLRLIAIDGIIVSASAYFVIWLYQPVLQMLQVPVFYFGFFHMILMASEIFVAMNFHNLDKWFGSTKGFLRFSAIVTALSFIAVAVFPNVITVVALVIFGGGFGLSRIEYMLIYMNRMIPSSERATILSSISMFRRLLLVFLNPVMGFVADRSLPFAALLSGLLALLIFFFSPLEKEILE